MTAATRCSCRATCRLEDDKPAPAILQAPAAAKDIEIENEDDWGGA